MGSILEIEAAIEKLPTTQVDELAVWLEHLRLRRVNPAALEVAATCDGTALSGVTAAVSPGSLFYPFLPR